MNAKTANTANETGLVTPEVIFGTEMITDIIVIYIMNVYMKMIPVTMVRNNSVSSRHKRTAKLKRVMPSLFFY